MLLYFFLENWVYEAFPFLAVGHFSLYNCPNLKKSLTLTTKYIAMKTTRLLPIILLLFTVIGLQAQTYNSGDSNTDLEGFQNTPAEISLLAGQNPQTLFRSPATATQGNTVFINQIGANNQAVVNTQSNSSEINVVQNGAGNDVLLALSADRIEETVLQNGDNNGYLHVNPFRLNYQGAEIIQSGNNQNIEWFGGNTLSERLKITMQGESQSLIVRNYN